MNGKTLTQAFGTRERRTEKAVSQRKRRVHEVGNEVLGNTSGRRAVVPVAQRVQISNRFKEERNFMAIELKELDDGKFIEVQASGKLTTEDYRQFVPEVEHAIQRKGRLRILFDMRDFHGWNTGGLWQDIKFDLRHFADIERLALVGEKRWQKWMAGACRPFTRAKIRYFDHEAANEARYWLASN